MFPRKSASNIAGPGFALARAPASTAWPRRLPTVAPLILAASVLVAMPAARADDSLYQAFGQQQGITEVVDAMVVNVEADPRIKAYFEGVSHKRIKQKLIEQFCVLTGGPCQYTGRSMADSHKGLGIDQPAFNALVEDLQLAMEQRHVPYHAQNQLLAKLAPMYRDIIEK